MTFFQILGWHNLEWFSKLSHLCHFSNTRLTQFRMNLFWMPRNCVSLRKSWVPHTQVGNFCKLCATPFLQPILLTLMSWHKILMMRVLMGIQLKMTLTILRMSTMIHNWLWICIRTRVTLRFCFNQLSLQLLLPQHQSHLSVRSAWLDHWMQYGCVGTSSVWIVQKISRTINPGFKGYATCAGRKLHLTLNASFREV